MKSAAGDDNKKEGIGSSLWRTLGSPFSHKASTSRRLLADRVEGIEMGAMLSEAEKAELAVFLRDHNNDIEGFSAGDETPLVKATRREHREAVTLLIKAGAQVNNGGDKGAGLSDFWAPLHAASHRGNSEIAECLIKARANIEQESQSGTPLSIAVFHNKIEVIKILLAHKANINRIVRGNTPLELAVSHYLRDVVIVLIEGKADLELRHGQDDSTPLLRAVKNTWPSEMVKLLLARGAGSNSATEALHHTVCSASYYSAHRWCDPRREAALLLLASPYVDYQKPCRAAFKNEYDSCEEALLKNGDQGMIAALKARKKQDRQRLGAELKGFLNEPALVAQYDSSILVQLLGMST